jgi:hypothetical protein
MANNLIKTCKIITTLRKEILMRNQAKIKQVINKITYQDRKNALPVRGDENAVTIAQSILNAQLQTSNILDAEMPTVFHKSVDLDWSAGAVNDTIVKLSRGDYEIEQNLLLSNGNVKIRMPQEVTASYGEYEETIRIRWKRVFSASGYLVYRNFGQPNEQLVSTGLAEIDVLDNNYAYFDDVVGDSAEHVYTVIARDANPEDNSEMTAPVTGKAYRLMTETIALSGYQEQVINTPAEAYDIELTVQSIAGARGQSGSNQGASGHSAYSGGSGGAGLDWTRDTPIIDGAHTFTFQSGSLNNTVYAAGKPYGGSGYYSGGQATLNYGGYQSIGGGGGGASRILMDAEVQCGAGGGGGGGARRSSAPIYYTSGGGGGGVFGAGAAGRGPSNSNPGNASGGAGGGGIGHIGGGYIGSKVSGTGTFGGNSASSGHGYINATLTWKE